LQNGEGWIMSNSTPPTGSEELCDSDMAGFASMRLQRDYVWLLYDLRAWLVCENVLRLEATER